MTEFQKETRHQLYIFIIYEKQQQQQQLTETTTCAHDMCFPQA